MWVYILIVIGLFGVLLGSSVVSDLVTGFDI